MYSFQMLNLRHFGPLFYTCWADNIPHFVKVMRFIKVMAFMKETRLPPFRHAETETSKITGQFWKCWSLPLPPLVFYLHGKDDNYPEWEVPWGTCSREGVAKCYVVNEDEQCPLYCTQCQHLHHFSPTSAFLPKLHFCLLCLSQSFSHSCLFQHLYRRFHNRFI